MNKFIKYKYLLMTIIFVGLIGSCSDDFLNRPPEDQYSVDTFYTTAEEVRASTNALYTQPWFNYFNFAAWTIGDMAPGNARTWDPASADFVNFAVTGQNNIINDAWNSLFAVVAQANQVINTLPVATAGSDVPQAIIDNAIGEARFIRATAYFYIVRLWGPVPIIEDNLAIITEPVVPRNPVDDIYEFIMNDLVFAANNITNTKANQPGRVSANGAKAMLAKVHLTRGNYQEAEQLAFDVIESDEFSLFNDYRGLFLTANDNNSESVFALQWGTTGAYAQGNAFQSYFAPAGVTGFSDGWGAVGPSITLQETYLDEDDDVRYRANIMQPDFTYPEINGGWTTSENLNIHGTNAGILKYVVGNVSSAGGGGSQSYPNNHYILRYADLLLVYAEAIAAQSGGTTTDQGALDAINAVRNRVDLPDLTVVTMDDIFLERRLELAFEGEFWFDVIRLGEAEAIAFLEEQNKGTYNNDEDPPAVNDEFYSPETSTDMRGLLFPYPSSEVIANPGLDNAPVDYNFNN